MPDIQTLQQSWPRPSLPRPIAIVGTGGIVRDAHLPAYRKADFTVAAAYDAEPERAQQLAKDWPLGRVCANMAELVETAQASHAVFDLALPPSAIAPVLQQLPDGATVLIQKPLGANLEQARAIVSLCQQKKLIAAVNHQLRFAPYMLALRDAVQRGWLGNVTDVEMQLNCGDPWHLFPFLERMERVEIQVHSIHYLDLIRSLLGEPRAVYALTLPDQRFPKLASTRSSIILNYGANPRVCLSLNHNYAHGAHRQASMLRVEGTQGVVWVQIGVMLDYPKGGADLFEARLAGDDWAQLRLQGSWFPDAFMGPMSNLQRFAAGEDKQLLTSVQDVLGTMALVEACYLSNASGGTPLPRL